MPADLVTGPNTTQNLQFLQQQWLRQLPVLIAPNHRGRARLNCLDEWWDGTQVRKVPIPIQTRLNNMDVLNRYHYANQQQAILINMQSAYRLLLLCHQIFPPFARTYLYWVMTDALFQAFNEQFHTASQPPANSLSISNVEHPTKHIGWYFRDDKQWTEDKHKPVVLK